MKNSPHLLLVNTEKSSHGEAKNLKNLLDGNANKSVRSAFSQAYSYLKATGAADSYIVFVRHSKGCLTERRYLSQLDEILEFYFQLHTGKCGVMRAI
jgi:hypothetical protein